MIALMMSKKTFDKLPPELQKAVREPEDGARRAARRRRRERKSWSARWRRRG